MYIKFPVMISIAAILFTVSITNAADNPKYSVESMQLTIPIVDTADQPGTFQNVTIEYAEGDLWRLVDFWEAADIWNLNSVEIVKTDTFPVQVFLRISGMFTNGCQKFGQTGYNWTDNLLNVYVYYVRIPVGIDCTADVTSFSQIIMLPVYGLDAGSYEFNLNNNFTGNFELDEDNRLN